MDVRCERCRTEYEFDDARITEAGVTVKCTVCGHVFKVKKKSLVVTVPVKPEELTEMAQRPPAPEPPPPAPEKPREWKVRQANGNVFSFRELTTLQKWIVERKVTRDDEISLTGESWKRLGNIAELASFFQVVEAADRATAPTAMYPPGFAPPAGYAGYPGYASQLTTPVALVPPPPAALAATQVVPPGPMAATQVVPPGAVAATQPPPPPSAPVFAPPPAAASWDAPSLASPASSNWEMAAPAPEAAAPAAAWEGQPIAPAPVPAAPAPAWEAPARDAAAAAAGAAWEQDHAGPEVSAAPASRPRAYGGGSARADESWDEAAPAASAPDPGDLSDLELAAVKGGGRRAVHIALGAAVGLALVAGGLFAWRTLGESPPPAAAVVAAAAEPPRTPPPVAPTATAAATPEPPADTPPVAAEPTPSAPAVPAEPQAAVAAAAEPVRPTPAVATAEAAVRQTSYAPKPATPADRADGDREPKAGAPAGKSFSWYLQQGLRKRERGQTTQALEMYEKAAEMMPDSAEPVTGKGFCLFDLGRLDAAQASFEDALRKNSRFSDALLGLGETWKEKGNKKKAIEYYRRYLDEAPNGPDANLAQANIERLSRE